MKAWLLALLLLLPVGAFGAYEFDGVNQYLSTSSTPLTAYPFSMSCWFNSDTITSSLIIMGIGTNGSGDQYWALVASGATAGDPVTLRVRTTTTQNANSTTGYSADTWHHAMGVGVNSSSRHAYIDGGSRGQSTTNRTPTGMDEITIASRSGPGAYLNGEAAECAIWNIAIGSGADTVPEIQALAAGVSPLLIRPDALVFYKQLIGTLDRPSWGPTLTNNNSSNVTAHPPGMIYPWNPISIGVPAAAESSRSRVMISRGQSPWSQRNTEIGKAAKRNFDRLSPDQQELVRELAGE